MRRDTDIVVTVKGVRVRRGLVEHVRREVASALADIGAFDVTAVGDPGFAGDGSSCDPEWMRARARIAARGLRVRVEAKP